jgi:DltD protein
MKSFRTYVITAALLLGLLLIYIPIRYNTPYPKDIGPKFDSHIRMSYIALLDEEQPDVLFLGDSMPGTGVDEKFVAEQLGKKVLMVSLPGTASTIWYLIIKNNIVHASHKPKYLVIFFRESMMTVPGYRVTGRYFALVDEFASPKDTLLIERAYFNQMTPLERFMEAYVPLYGSRWTIRESLDYYIRYSLGGVLLNCKPVCMDQGMEVVFKQNNLDLTFLSDAINAADDYLYTRDALNFQEQIGKSFLPEIMRLCKENNIQLILVRMPILRFYDVGTQPSELDRYIQDMSIYLEENDVPFLDLDRKDMQVELFSDTLHLNDQGKVVFTRELTKALKGVIK